MTPPHLLPSCPSSFFLLLTSEHISGPPHTENLKRSLNKKLNKSKAKHLSPTVYYLCEISRDGQRPTNTEIHCNPHCVTQSQIEQAVKTAYQMPMTFLSKSKAQCFNKESSSGVCRRLVAAVSLSRTPQTHNHEDAHGCSLSQGGTCRHILL